MLPLFSVRACLKSGSHTLIGDIDDMATAMAVANRLSRFAELGFISGMNNMPIESVEVFHGDMYIGTGRNLFPAVNKEMTRNEVCSETVHGYAIMAYDKDSDVYACVLNNIGNLLDAMKFAMQIWQFPIRVTSDPADWLEIWAENSKDVYIVTSGDSDKLFKKTTT